MKNYTNLNSINLCPITGSNESISYFDLGNFPLVNNLNDTREESLSCDKYPLSINFFTKSNLTSLSFAVDGSKLFSNYLFKSEINLPYYNHCKKMFEYINEISDINENDLFVDIGGNDGTLLSAFREQSNISLDYLNIDPSKNITKISIEKKIPVLVEFFSKETVKLINKKAKIIVSTNVFQHLRDINSFVSGVYELLEDDGMWILEFPYWIHDMETYQFDQIYHEHIYYYSVIPLYMMMKKHKLKIIRIEKQDIHGGTLRLVMVKESSDIDPDDSIITYIESEKKYDIDYYKGWGNNVMLHLDKCKQKINELLSNNKKIAAFGAAAKGCIFLNALGLTHKDIEFIVDDTDIKQGKFMPGTGIQIVNREFLKDKNIDYLIILAHNFSDFIVKSLKNDYSGEFITFLPFENKL